MQPMQSQYLRLDCVRRQDDCRVCIEIVERKTLDAIPQEMSFSEAGLSLAEQLLWQDFGHYGDWQKPSSHASINSQVGWQVGIFRTILADDICMLARLPPKGKEFCLPANDFASRLLRPNAETSSVEAVSGRTLLVKVVDSSSDVAGASGGKTFCSLSANEFAACLSRVDKEITANVSFRFPVKTSFSSDAGTLAAPASSCDTQWTECDHPVTSGAVSFIRLSCSRDTSSDTSGWTIHIEPLLREALPDIETPIRFADLRRTLAESLLWQDFGHDSDWRDPSSDSRIRTKFGWEIGLLETKLGDDICMLARKPPPGEERSIPFNHLATQIRHERHRQWVKFVNGTVLIAKLRGNVSEAHNSTRPNGCLSFQSLHVREFLQAFNLLDNDLRSGLSLQVGGKPLHKDEAAPIGDLLDSFAVVQQEACSDFSETCSVQQDAAADATDGQEVPLVHAEHDEGWEWVVQAESHSAVL